MTQAQHLPTIYAGREYPETGALMSYGPYWTELFRNAAEQVDKVLRGAKPADIPVEQPTKFYLVINAKAAKAIGLELSAIAARSRRRSDRVMSRMSASGTNRTTGDFSNSVATGGKPGMVQKVGFSSD